LASADGSRRGEGRVAVLHLLAAATTPPSGGVPFDITQVLQFGLLGLIFLCLVFRKFIVPEWTLKQAEERAQKEKDDLAMRLSETREQLDKLQAVFQDQMIPALTRATEINARYTDELQKARYRRGSKENPED
jgi:hypothetical protein